VVRPRLEDRRAMQYTLDDAIEAELDDERV
jgi:hypothetical protein